jgi:large subunit ribosomal protein L25
MAYTLTAEKREQTGRQLAVLRAESKFPAVLYGTGITENQKLAVNLQEFTKVYRESGQSQVVELTVDGKHYDVIVRARQINPITRDAIHADFYVVDINKVIEVKIPLEFTGIAPAVKSSGGSLMKKLNALTVQCLPKNIVKHIEVPLEVIKTLDDNILVSDLTIPEGLEVMVNEADLVATVVPPRIEVDPTVQANEDAAAAAEDAGAEGAEAAPAEGEEEKKK